MSNERLEWPISEEELHAYVDNLLDPERQHPDASLIANGSIPISDDGCRRNNSRQPPAGIVTVTVSASLATGSLPKRPPGMPDGTPEGPTQTGETPISAPARARAACPWPRNSSRSRSPNRCCSGRPMPTSGPMASTHSARPSRGRGVAICPRPRVNICNPPTADLRGKSRCGQRAGRGAARQADAIHPRPVEHVGSYHRQQAVRLRISSACLRRFVAASFAIGRIGDQLVEQHPHGGELLFHAGRRMGLLKHLYIGGDVGTPGHGPGAVCGLRTSVGFRISISPMDS